MRAAVIGCGIMGACAAYELARAGVAVTAYEQFDIDHDRGSSFGDSRIIRRFYDDAYYTDLMRSAYPLWEALQRQTGQTLWERLGGLYFGPRAHSSLHAAERGMLAAGAVPQLLEASDLRKRFRAFRFSDEEAGVFDRDAGSLRASLCVQTVAATAQDSGVAIRTRTAVDSIEEVAGGIRVRASGESVVFNRAVIAGGAWTARLLPGLGALLRPTRQQYVHLVPTRDREFFAAGTMPIWIDAARSWYGFPEHGAVAGVKLASHEFGETVDPDAVRREIDPEAIAATRTYAQHRLPALAGGEVSYAKTCLYTVSPDEDFIVDVVPNVPRCCVIAGCSGHAFKFAPLLGAVAADLALDRAPRVDIARFRTARFS